MARNEKRGRMAALLKEWRRSGESAAVFCRRRGINPQRLWYWKRVLGPAAGPVRRAVRRRSVTGLVPVQLIGTDTNLGAGSLEIHMAGGERIVFPPGGSLDVLREVMALLRERC